MKKKILLSNFVGRVVLIPTKAQTTNKFNRSNKNQYANIFDFIEAFYFANLGAIRSTNITTKKEKIEI